MKVKPPPGLVAPRETLFRRTQRKMTFFLGTVLRQRLIQILVCLVIVGIHIALLSTPALERIEMMVLDTFFKYRPHPPTHPSIALIEIAEDGLQAIGRWPWPRHYHAVLMHLLHQWGARAVVLDILFSEPSTPFDDGALSEAIKENKEAYLPVVLEPEGERMRWIHSLGTFETSARGVGHINIAPDSDGKIRRIQPYLQYENESHPHLALKVAFDILGRDLPSRDQLPFPRDARGNLLINWSGKWKDTFEHYSYVDLVKSFESAEGGGAPEIDPEKIRGKVCLIGVTATGHVDIKPTPVESAYPALGVHANVINSILTNRFVYPASRAVNALGLAGIGIFLLCFLVPFRNVLSSVAAALLALMWIGIAFLGFAKAGVWLSVAHTLLMILSLFIFSAVYTVVIGHKEQLRLFQLATRDGLTGLYVIRHFRTLLNRAAVDAKKRKEPLTVILFDVDHFKKVNDTYGHPAGDIVLREVGRILRSHETPKGSKETKPFIPARYGGEEFIVMLPNTNLTDAAFNVAEKVRKEVEQTIFQWENTKIPVTISLGVAVLRDTETVPDPMVHRADEALYRSKEGGRNRTSVEADVTSAPADT